MNRIRNHSKELIVLTILLAVAVSVVNAAVFVYYPINITARWSQRPLYFSTGTNANNADINGTIIVRLSDEDTSAVISVHPSRRGTTRYKDILRIVNGNNSQTYYVGFTVDTTTFDSGEIEEAKLIVTTIGVSPPESKEINLKETGLQGWYITLNADSQLRVDLRFKISSNYPGGSATARINLVYSPTTESPEG